jgi:hypothetical protein
VVHERASPLVDTRGGRLSTVGTAGYPSRGGGLARSSLAGKTRAEKGARRGDRDEDARGDDAGQEPVGMGLRPVAKKLVLQAELPHRQRLTVRSGAGMDDRHVAASAFASIACGAGGRKGEASFRSGRPECDERRETRGRGCATLCARKRPGHLLSLSPWRRALRGPSCGSPASAASPAQAPPPPRR